MLIKCIPVGHIEANCYVVTDESSLKCAVIDPGDEFNTIMDYIEDTKLRVEAIFLTHGHYDHTGAAVSLSEETGAPIWINRADVTDTPESYRFLAPEGTRFYSAGALPGLRDAEMSGRAFYGRHALCRLLRAH